MNSDNSCQLVIEDRVSIGPRVTLVLAADPNNSKLIEQFPPVRGSITIRNDAWLGAGVIILPNVTIAEFSVVAAGAVVNKNTDPYTVVGGVPAVKIKDIDR
jgi:acetyltransferase-like isoleucine patch superfamily enzyme